MPEKEVISIGVTGHRILAELDRVVAGIDQALDIIKRTFPGSHFNILSSIAEGADRIVARRAMEKLNANLVAVLPLPQETYEEDFAAEESKRAFLKLLDEAIETVAAEECNERPNCYAQAGRYIVGRSDVMIAVWDGLPAQGKGGVGEIVAYARSLGRPIVVVAAGNRVPGTEEPSSLGNGQGSVYRDGEWDPR